MTGLSASTLDALDDAELDAGAVVAACSASPSAPTRRAMLGSYTVADGALRFTPLFPFDPGRQYQVRFDAARLPGAGADTAA